MDDHLSWRAKLARTNINILNITWNDDSTVAEVFFEFMYRPYNGSIKWCKTYTQVAGAIDKTTDVQLPVTGDDIANTLRREVLELRKELER